MPCVARPSALSPRVHSLPSDLLLVSASLLSISATWNVRALLCHPPLHHRGQTSARAIEGPDRLSADERMDVTADELMRRRSKTCLPMRRCCFSALTYFLSHFLMLIPSPTLSILLVSGVCQIFRLFSILTSWPVTRMLNVPHRCQHHTPSATCHYA